MTKGPITQDKEFFEALSDELKETKTAARRNNYKEAASAFSQYVRLFLDSNREKFFSIPYETPENIYKLPGESDSEAVKRIEEYKVVSVGIIGDFSERKRIGWFDNPTANGYKEWTWQLSRHNDIKMMAHEYNLTGDEKIASAAIDIMKSWIEDAPVPPAGTSGHDTKCWRTIECGIRMGANWPYILYSFYKSPAFTDEMMILWFKSIYEHAIRLVHDRTAANWLLMEMNGLAHIGMLYPFFKDSEAWLNDAVSSLEKECRRQFYPDGFQYELTTNYHDVAINNYQRLLETAKAFSVRLPDGIMETLRIACDINTKLMMPDGTLPDINDGTRAKAKDLLLPKTRFFRDRDIDWAVFGGEDPGYTSTVLPYSGFAVFRTGWKKDDVWALFDAAPFGRGHQHEDKLNLIIYAAGKYLVPEAGIYAYDDSEMRKYVLSTRGHNTVRVDGHDQDRRSTYQWNDEEINRKADIKTTIPSDDIEWAESTYSEGYQDIGDKTVKHTRKVIFLRHERIFIVVDTLQAQKEHKWEVLWHIDDEAVSDFEYENLRIFVPSHDVGHKIIRGVTEPEWQGFIAFGAKQGMYKEVNTLVLSAYGNNSRIITALVPKDRKGQQPQEVRTEGNSIILVFADKEERRISL